MKDIKERVQDARDRADSLLGDLMQLEKDIKPESEEEGTVKARVQEALPRLHRVKSKLENASNIAVNR